MIGFGVWLRAMRIQFLQASVLPVLLGAALGYHEASRFWETLGIMIVAIAAVNIGTNLANDYYDHRSGADEGNRDPTPFSGGSRVIQERLIPPSQVLRASILFYALGAVLGLVLTWIAGWGLLLFGVFGIVLSYFYTAPPLKLGYRGMGEVLVGILLGPVSVLGAYYVYTRRIGMDALALSLPVGLLVAAILYINQFPDAASDAAAGKRHWVVRLGKPRGVKVYILIVFMAYLSITLSAVSGLLPAWTLLSLVTLPVAIRASRILCRSYERTTQMLPAMGLTITLHLSVGLLLLAGLILDGWLSP